MAAEKPRLYEALFLLRQKEIASDFGACVEHVREILRRADAEVIALQKWDERRLAYDVKGQRRGTYFLGYFNALPSKLTGMERDCNLSETVLRMMVLKAEYVGDVELETISKMDDIDAEVQLRAKAAAAAEAKESTPAASKEAPAEEAKEEAAPEAPEAPEVAVAVEQAPVAEEAAVAEQAPAVEEAGEEAGDEEPQA